MIIVHDYRLLLSVIIIPHRVARVDDEIGVRVCKTFIDSLRKHPLLPMLFVKQSDDPSLVRFYKCTSHNESYQDLTDVNFECLYCNFECNSSKVMEAHWGKKMSECSFSLDTCARFEPERAKNYRRKYGERCCVQCLWCCLSNQCVVGCSGLVCLFALYYPILAAFCAAAVYTLAMLLRIVMPPVFIGCYMYLIIKIVQQQIEGLDFTDLFLALMMPTIDVTLINISFPMMVTILSSISLSISRFVSMCFKGIAFVSKASGKSLKKITSQRHALKAKKSVKSAGQEGKCCTFHLLLL